MQNRVEVEAKLRQETRDAIFNRQIAQALAKKQDERQRSGQLHYADLVNSEEYNLNRPTFGQDPEVFKVEGDDKWKTKKWEAMMSDCAFYFDKPTISEESAMKRTLLTKYDDLFPGVAMRPTLQSRKDLVNWACAAQNAFMQNKGAPAENVMDCTRYQGLLDKYGPNYSSLKGKVGHLRGLFD